MKPKWSAEKERVVRTAMRLYKHWAKSSDPVFWPEGFWYPLGSKKQAVPFGKACAALRDTSAKRVAIPDKKQRAKKVGK